VDELSSARSARPLALRSEGLPVGGEVQLVLGGQGAGQSRSLSSPEVDLTLWPRRPEDVNHAQALIDADAPKVLGVQRGAVHVGAIQGPAMFLVDFSFQDSGCAQTPRVGDLIRTDTHMAEVKADGSAPVGGLAIGILVEVVAGDPASFATDRGHFASTWDPAEGAAPSCFVLFTAQAQGAQSATGVDPASLIAFRFNETLHAPSVSTYDGFQLRNEGGTPTPNKFVVGKASVGAGGSVAYFDPSLPLGHQAGSSEQYFAELTDAITDPAGNQLEDFPVVSFSLDAAAPSVSSGGYVLRFSEVDEDGNGAPELRGQISYDLQDGVLNPRPVARFTASFDATHAVPGLMSPFPQGVQGPLSPLGSKEMSVLRHVDASMSFGDESTHNLDVERMYWAPAGGVVIADFYPEFEIALAHSERLPDEAVNPISLLPLSPNSGLHGQTFDGNALEDELQVVHPRRLGYTLSPLDLVAGSAATPAFMPYPLNSGSDPSQFEYFTWRDTATLGLGASNGNGVEPLIAEVAGLIPPGSAGQQAAAGFVPTIGLPLLMEFSCFPSGASLGLNAFDVSLAINSSARPNFRVFSTGGINSSGQLVVKDPDLELVPSGGFNPNSSPPGQPTAPADNVFFPSRIDFVTRVNTAHSLWIDSGTSEPDWSLAQVIEVERDVAGDTSIELAFRGADQVFATSDGAPHEDALVLDPYGDQANNDMVGVPGDPAQKNSGVVFTNADASWKSSLDEVDGSRFVQVRITFVGDTATNLTTALDSLALAYQ